MNIRTSRGSVRDFASADVFLGSKDERPLENNTRLLRRGRDAIAVRLYWTDVVTYHRDGSVTLDTGGWMTVVTKDRINGHNGIEGINIWSDRGRWFVNKFTPDAEGGYHERIGWYFDGIRLSVDGTILNPVGEKEAPFLPRAHRTNYTPTGYYGAMR